MKLSYKKLVDINILHRYYEDELSRDFAILPTIPTRAKLRNYQLLPRSTETGLLLLASVSGANERLSVPIPLSESLQLTFSLKLKTPHFLNFTKLPLKNPEISYLPSVKTGYYFSNLSDNATTTPNRLLLSKEHVDNVASEKDRIVYLPKIFHLQFAPITDNFTLTIREEDDTLVKTLNIAEPTPFDNYRIDLSEFASGRYNLTLNSEPKQTIYLDNEMFHSAPFGIVEIFHRADVPDGNPATTADYKLIGGSDNNQITSKTYYIQFDNREAIWKYIFPGGTTDIISIASPAGSLFTKSGQEYTSPAFLKIQEKYQKILMNKDAVLSNLPNPNEKNIIPIVNATNDIIGFKAEVYL